jgi:hypothetical protein
MIIKGSIAKIRVLLILDLGLALALLGILSYSGSRVSVVYAAGSRYVSPGGMDIGNDCTDNLTPCATVQHAVDMANSADIIKVATGSYTGVNNYGGLAQVVYISKTVTIQGGYTPAFTELADPEANPTILNAQGQGWVLYIVGDISPTIEGLQITGGSATGLESIPAGIHAGGGVHIVSATLTFNYNQVIGNAATYGGGLHLAHGVAILGGNKFEANLATEGGGGISLNFGEAIIYNNTITANVAGLWGGGLYPFESVLMLDHNIILTNSAKFGGGVFLNAGAAALHGNTISDNAAEFGGGLFSNSSKATFEGDIVASNNADEGGGIYLFRNSSGALTNTVIADNQAILNGGGMLVIDSDAQLVHTSIAANLGGDGSGIYVADSSVVSLTNTILVSQTVGITIAQGSMATLDSILWYDNNNDWNGIGTINTSNNYTGDPVFIDSKYHIGLASAALDRGINTGVTIDIDGELRPQGVAPDLGADEAAPSIQFNQRRFLPLILKQ